MKSKNIPVDIRSKSIKEAQNEIREIMGMLEKTDIDLEKTTEQYNRMIQLNNHIHLQFKKKANEIRQLALKKNKKNKKNKKKKK